MKREIIIQVIESLSNGDEGVQQFTIPIDSNKLKKDLDEIYSISKIPIIFINSYG